MYLFAGRSNPVLFRFCIFRSVGVVKGNVKPHIHRSLLLRNIFLKAFHIYSLLTDIMRSNSASQILLAIYFLLCYHLIIT